MRLGPGDTLMLYTDGLTEARTDDVGGRYGEEALLDFADGLAPVGAEAAVAAVARLLDGFGTGLDDDTALLALGVPPAAEEVRDAGAATGVPHGGAAEASGTSGTGDPVRTA